mgnify:CR=1 FL=1
MAKYKHLGNWTNPTRTIYKKGILYKCGHLTIHPSWNTNGWINDMYKCIILNLLRKWHVFSWQQLLRSKMEISTIHSAKYKSSWDEIYMKSICTKFICSAPTIMEVKRINGYFSSYWCTKVSNVTIDSKGVTDLSGRHDVCMPHIMLYFVHMYNGWDNR